MHRGGITCVRITPAIVSINRHFRRCNSTFSASVGDTIVSHALHRVSVRKSGSTYRSSRELRTPWYRVSTIIRRCHRYVARVIDDCKAIRSSRVCADRRKLRALRKRRATRVLPRVGNVRCFILQIFSTSVPTGEIPRK